ncbi:MAG: hypothetical protein ABI780_01430 [Ardenticatenales bacterium]
MTVPLRRRAPFVASFAVIVVLAAAALAAAGARAQRPDAPSPSQSPRPAAADDAPAVQLFGRLPTYVVPNGGQADPWATHVLCGRTTSVLFGPGGVSYRLARPAADAATRCGPTPERGICIAEWRAPMPPDAVAALPAGGHAGDAASGTVDAVLQAFVGGRTVAPVAEAPTGARISFLRGSRDRWIRGLPAYERVVYPDVWPGIDVVYEAEQDRVKQRFVVRPGTDPAAIRLAWRGARALRLDASGGLVVDTAAGPLRDDAPVAWQDGPAGRTPVAVRYRLGRGGDGAAEDAGIEGAAGGAGGAGGAAGDAAMAAPGGGIAAAPESAPGGGGTAYDFALGAYDPDRTLVIDPAVLVWAGFVGGSGYDRGLGIAIDPQDNVYLSGNTNDDAFVAKFSADGRRLIYEMVFGGAERDGGFDVDVDATGAAYVTGPCSSLDFPTYRGPDLTFGGATVDTFVAKLTPAGDDLVYSGFIGGAGTDFGEGIVVDAAGNAYVSGLTESTEATFPVKVGPDLTQNGSWDAFVTKVVPEPFAPDALDNFVYSGFIGGAGYDVAVTDYYWSAGHIGVDDAGNAYMSGQTTSTGDTFPDGDGFGDLPTWDGTFNGTWDAYVAKIRADGTGLAYAGYIGGDDWDEGKGMAIDADGAAYVTGRTWSSEATFPVKVGPDLTFNGLFDAFLAKVAPDGRSLEFAGYIGGDDDDSGQAVELGPDGALYVIGHSDSSEGTFPATNGPDVTFNGPEGLPDDQPEQDAIVGRLRSPVDTGDPRDNWDYLGYVGGSEPDYGFWLDVDTDSNVYLGGETSSGADSFPNGQGMAGVPGLGVAPHGDLDAFAAKIAWRPHTGRTAYLPWVGRSADHAADVAPAPFVPTATNTPRIQPTNTITPPPTPTALPRKPGELGPGEELVFYDDFSDDRVAWRGQGDGAFAVVDETLELSVGLRGFIAAIPPTRFTDGAFEATVQRTAGFDADIGLTIGPEFGGFFLWIQSDGRYYVSQRYAGGDRLLLQPRLSPFLSPATASFRLRIERVGPHVDLFVNGHPLASIDHPDIAERGVVALLLESSGGAAKARYDDVLVTRFGADRPTPTDKPTAAPTPIPTAAPTTAPGSDLFHDDFGDPTTGWLVVNNESLRARYVNDEYELALHVPFRVAASYAPRFSCDECTVTATTHFASAILGAAGLLLGEGVGDDAPSLAAAIVSDGRFLIQRSTAAGSNIIVQPTASSAVRTGAGAVNRVKAIRTGGQLRFYVNDVLLHTMSEPGLRVAGVAGFVVISQSEPEVVARFDDFRVVAGAAAVAGVAGAAGVGEWR